MKTTGLIKFGLGNLVILAKENNSEFAMLVASDYLANFAKNKEINKYKFDVADFAGCTLEDAKEILISKIKTQLSIHFTQILKDFGILEIAQEKFEVALDETTEFALLVTVTETASMYEACKKVLSFLIKVNSEKIMRILFDMVIVRAPRKAKDDDEKTISPIDDFGNDASLETPIEDVEAVNEVSQALEKAETTVKTKKEKASKK